MQRIIRYVLILALLTGSFNFLTAQKNLLDRTVKLSLQEAPLNIVFENLEINNDIVVSYSSSIVDVSVIKSFSANEYICRELFEYLLEDQAVRAISRGKKILIIPDPNKSIGFTRLKPKNYYTIHGYVKDGETGEALIGTSIYNPLTNRGTITNEFGYYSLTMPEGKQTVNYSFVGYNPKSITYKLNKRKRSDIYLDSNIEIEEILVIDQDSSQIWRGREKLNLDDIKFLPALFGEVDVLKAISLLPGIQSGNEAQGGLIVRGGSPDQNLVILDGMPLYESNHLFGLVSIFNEDVINNVNIYKSDFSAKYGGRLSSVVDIQLKDGNYKNFHGSATLGLLGGKFNLEGPIQKEKSSFNIAGRTSWIEQIAAPTINNFLNVEGTQFGYYDLNLKIRREFQSTNSITFSSYIGRDRIAYMDQTQQFQDRNLSTTNRIRWGNEVASLRWSRLFGSKMFSNLTLGYVNYRYLYHVDHSLEVEGGTSSQDYTVASTSRIFDRTAKLEFDYFQSNKLDFKFGAGYTLHTYNPAVKQASILIENDVESLFGGIVSTNASEFSLYAESYFRPLANISIHTGVHYALFSVRERQYGALQPRISANYGLPWNGYIGASYSRMNQFIHLLGNPGLGLPIDLWVPSTAEIEPELADQFTLSYNMDLGSMFKLHSALYYKSFDNLLAFRSAYDLFSPVINDLDITPVFNESQDWESRVESGGGQAFGWEFQIKKTKGKTTGNISYTFGRSNRQFEGISRGLSFPYRYDRRHDLSLSLIHNYSNQLNFGLLWLYGTGNAYTLPVDEFFSIDGEVVLDYSTRNNQRLPDFHRLDISMNYLKIFRGIKMELSVGAFNTYNRRNPYYAYLYQDPISDQYSLRQISIFPILPYVNAKFSF